MFKNLKHALFYFLSIKSNYQLYSLINKSQEIQFYNQAIINQSIQLINTNPKLCEKHI